MPDVGNDTSRQVAGAARCELVDAVPFIDFARERLDQLLRMN